MARGQTYGERLGGFAAELWKALQVLGGFARPMYTGREWVVNGATRGVLCKLLIYARDNEKASRPINITVRRSTFEIGIQEASRLALRRICYDYFRELDDTVFRLHPAAQAAWRLRVAQEENATTVHLARFAAAQEDHARDTAEELEMVYEALRVAERELQDTRIAAAERIEELEHALQEGGQAAPAPLEDDSGEDSEEDPEEIELEPEEPEDQPAAGHQDQFAPAPAHPPEYEPGQPQSGWLDE